MTDTTSRIITSPSGVFHLDAKEIFKYRELLYTFVWRDIKVRYKQTALGVAWAVFQPLTSMVVFSIFFGNLAKVPSDGIPYPVFVFSGLLFWNYFSTALTNCSNSLIDNESIIKKIYFPRLILPVAAVGTPIVDFLVSWTILFFMMLFYDFRISFFSILVTPGLLILSAVSALGIGTFLAAVNSRYRDVRYILPFFIQLLLFITPVIYPVGIVPESLKWILFINPMTAVVEISRSLLFGGMHPNMALISISIISSIFLFVSGVFYFKKTESYLADLL
jgi:lipopolysaccharide transport system permease protein